MQRAAETEGERERGREESLLWRCGLIDGRGTRNKTGSKPCLVISNAAKQLRWRSLSSSKHAVSLAFRRAGDLDRDLNPSAKVSSARGGGGAEALAESASAGTGARGGSVVATVLVAGVASALSLFSPASSTRYRVSPGSSRAFWPSRTVYNEVKPFILVRSRTFSRSRRTGSSPPMGTLMVCLLRPSSWHSMSSLKTCSAMLLYICLNYRSDYAEQDSTTFKDW